MEQRIRELIIPLSEKLIKHLSEMVGNTVEQEKTLFWIEVTVLVLVAAMGRELLRGIIHLLYGMGYHGSRITCARCGQWMKFQRYARRPLLSVFGDCSYERAYYYCRGCGAGVAPLDEQLGVGERELSPKLQRIIGYVGGHVSFGVVEKVLYESYGIEVSTEAIRQVGEEVGQDARQWEETERRTYEEKPLPSRPRGQEPKTWVLELDGKMVGFQDGSWQEVKTGVIYELAARVEIQPGRQELLKRELIARRCHWEEFIPDMWAAMHRAGVHDGDQLVTVADGARALDQIFEYVAPEATRIRDFYHVAEKIYAIGELRFGGQTAEAQHWIRGQLAKLKASELSAVIRSIAHMKCATNEAKQKRSEVVRYLRRHRAAMNYGRYLQEGWPIGSGAVEGGCKLVGLRTNGCGRRWGLPGCDQVVALRVAVLNDRLNQIRPQPNVELRFAV